MIRCAAVGVLLMLGAVPIPGQPSSADPFAPLRFLAGNWRGDQSGEPGHGTSERTYEFVFTGRFLQVKNTSTYPQQEKNKNGEVHHDMGMIGFDRARKKFVFRQFHQEGFVNTYVHEDSGDPKKIVFTSEAIENIAAGWRARETYLILSNDEFIERFELAEPGKDFALYSEARLKRVSAALGAQDKPPQPPTADPWQSLRFLIGTWEARTQGGSAGAASSGTYVFRLELRNHVLARHTASAGCTGPSDFDCEHDDVLYVYQDSAGQPLKAVYFDNEGHVIYYDVAVPKANTVVFLSPSSQPGPQFRLTYELKGRTMEGKFEVRMPGQSGFKSYLEWSGAGK